MWLRFLCGAFGVFWLPLLVWGWLGGFGGVCFENFIVDASIFVDFVVVFLASY